MSKTHPDDALVTRLDVTRFSLIGGMLSYDIGDIVGWILFIWWICEKAVYFLIIK
jgi:hypothetical protein